VNDEQSLLAALEASRAHPGPTLLDIKVLPKTMTHDYASWWRTGDAQVAESSAVREAAEQTQAQVKKPVSIEFSRRNEIFISFLFSLTLTLSHRERGRIGAVYSLSLRERAGVRELPHVHSCCEIDNKIYLIHLKSVNPHSKT
jgi:hypothetical protein